MTAGLATVAASLGTVEGLTIQVGRQLLAAHAAPPRIVWVPTRGAIKAPKQQESRTQHTVANRLVGFEAHIWGATDEAAESLLHTLIGLMASRLTRHAFELGDEDWTHSGAAIDCGSLVILSASVIIPVFASELSTATAVTTSLDSAVMVSRMGEAPEEAAP